MSTGQMFATAMQYHRSGRFGEAEAIYRQILQADSNNADALHMLGVLALQTGRLQLAIEMIGRAIRQNDQVPSFHNNLGNAHAAAGQWPDAEAAFRRALDRKRDYAEAHYNLGNALREQGKAAEAEASYRRALTVRPTHADTYLNLSDALQAQGRLEEAAEACQKAISLRPDLAAAHNNLGNILIAQNRFDAALGAYSRAIELKPSLAEAHHNRGLALLRGGRVDEAVACCRQALVYRPGYVAACVTLGHALTQAGQAEAAVQSYDRALALDPGCGEAMLGRAIAAIPIIPDNVTVSDSAAKSFEDRLNGLVQWAGANPGKLGEAVGNVQPFYLAYRPADVTDVLCRYGDLASAEAAAHWGSPVNAQDIGPVSGSTRNRIRIAIVSGQVKHHPVWDVILRGLIARLNTQEFEIFLYHTAAAIDAETDWARGQVARFIQGPKSIQYWLSEIAEARPDVLFYPEIGMDPTTCSLATLRLAPLQIAAWGHPVTSGLPTIDWYLSAALLEGAQAEQHYREKLVRLPGTGVCTESPALQEEPWGGPARRKGVVRFALCQQPLKFDPQDDLLLPRIAKAAGAAEFWLATPGNMPWTALKVRERIAAAFRAEGLDPQAYLRATPWLPRRQFLSFLDEMDIYLDCPAFSGYTTAWQALHRGLPILTVEGPYLRQRLAAGLLRQVGITDGIASSRDQYVTTAVSWAAESQDVDRWTARRAELRGAAARADGNAEAIRAFEQKLRGAIRR